MKGIRMLRSPVWPILLIVGLLGIYLTKTVVSIRELYSHEHASVFYDYRYRFVVDIGKPDSEFDQEFLRGAQECAKEYGIALEINGLNSSFDSESVDFYTWTSYVRPDGMITANIMDAAARQQMAATGIACCVVYNDPADGNFLYVGPDNYAQGYLLAKQLGEKYAGRTLNVALLYAEQEKMCPDGRLQGFIAGARESANLRLFAEQAVEPGVLRGMGVAEDIMLSFGEIDYFVCLDEVLLTGTVRGVVDLNRVKNIKVSGIGMSEEIESYIENSIVDFAMDSDGYAIGRLAVENLYLYKQKTLNDDRVRTMTGYRLVGGT